MLYTHHAYLPKMIILYGALFVVISPLPKDETEAVQEIILVI
jgi:hypothetical protein